MAKKVIDIPSLSKNLGQKDTNLPQVYKLRREKLSLLEKEVKELLIKRDNGTISKKELGRLSQLPREIKAVTVTDPNEVFKYRKGKWEYKREFSWKIKGKPLFPGAKNPETHHKAGLDKYYNKIKGWDDADIQRLHQNLAKKGVYLGNHPKNAINLDPSIHVGRARQNTPSYESIHGAIDYKDLTDDQWDEIIDRVVSDDVTDFDFNLDSDIGSPGDPKVGRRKRTPIPDDEFFDFASDEVIERIGDMATDDYSLADEFSNKPVNKNLLWEGKSSYKVSEFIKNNKVNEAFWPEDTLEAIRNNNVTRLIEIEKELPQIREASMLEALKSGGTLQDWQQRNLLPTTAKELSEKSNQIKTEAGLEVQRRYKAKEKQYFTDQGYNEWKPGWQTIESNEVNGGNGGNGRNGFKFNGKKVLGGAAGLITASNFLPSPSAAEEIRDEVSQGEIGEATKTYGKDLLIGQTASRAFGGLLKLASLKLSGKIGKKVIGRQLLKKGAALATGPAAPIVMGGLLIKDAYDVANVIFDDKFKIKDNRDMTTEERRKATDLIKFIK